MKRRTYGRQVQICMLKTTWELRHDDRMREMMREQKWSHCVWAAGTDNHDDGCMGTWTRWQNIVRRYDERTEMASLWAAGTDGHDDGRMGTWTRWQNIVRRYTTRTWVDARAGGLGSSSLTLADWSIVEEETGGHKRLQVTGLGGWGWWNHARWRVQSKGDIGECRGGEQEGQWQGMVDD